MVRTLIVAAATLLVLCEGVPIRERSFDGKKSAPSANPGFDYLHLVQASTSKENFPRAPQILPKFDSCCALLPAAKCLLRKSQGFALKR
jgi:hypothetical protein